MTRQQGFLLISAILLTVTMGLVATTTTKLTIVSSTHTSHTLERNAAQAAADAGLQAGLSALINNTVDCDEVTGTASLTNTSIPGAQFTVTADEFNNDTTTLTTDISATATTIPVSAISNFASMGYAVIGSERIYYGGLSNSSSTCGTAPCLTHVKRGKEDTTASAHSAGATLNQRLCQLTAVGAAPSFTNQQASATEQVNVDWQPVGKIGWAVGKSVNDDFYQWDGAITWAQIGYNPAPTRLHDIVIVDRDDAWAVGSKYGNMPTIIHWDGSRWTRQWISTASAFRKNLNGIDCTARDNCWAVGHNRTFLHWDGTEWGLGNVDAGVPNIAALAVSCPSSSQCWAVLQKHNNTVNFAHWNGTTWTLYGFYGPKLNRTMLDVNCSAEDDCWAVGTARTFLHWDGTSWTEADTSAITNSNYRGVYCNDSNDCWAVGDIRGTLLTVHYDGNSWSRVETGITRTGNLYGVHCTANDACIASGTRSTIIQWDGIQWRQATTVSSPTKTLFYAVAAIDQPGAGYSMPPSFWR